MIAQILKPGVVIVPRLGLHVLARLEKQRVYQAVATFD
jgi:hypothetical protein